MPFLLPTHPPSSDKSRSKFKFTRFWRIGRGRKCFHGSAQIFDQQVRVRSSREFDITVPEDSLDPVDVHARSK